MWPPDSLSRCLARGLRAPLVLCIVTFLAPHRASASVRYVRAFGASPPFDGLTWATAFQTIGAALNVVEAGDEIWVAGGEYDENIAITNAVGVYGGFAGYETARAQRFGNLSESSIVTRNGAPAVTLYVGNSTLSGFTIRAAPGQESAAAACIRVQSGTPMIAGNYILSQTGSAISCIGGDPRINRNTLAGSGFLISVASGHPIISENILSTTGASALNCYGGVPFLVSDNAFGNGGIFIGFPELGGGGSCHITGNDFANGKVQIYTRATGVVAPAVTYNTFHAGGISIVGESPGVSAEVSDNWLIGGGIEVSGIPVSIARNVIQQSAGGAIGASMDTSDAGDVYVFDNVVDRCGAGIFVATHRNEAVNLLVAGNSVTGCNGVGISALSRVTSSPPGWHIESNLVAGNTTGISTSFGDLNSTGTHFIVNNTICGNGTGINADGALLASNIVAFNSRGIVAGSPSATITLRNNDVYANPNSDAPADYVGLPDATGQNGNIRMDPSFADPGNGDYHLAGGPCVDAGSHGDVLTFQDRDTLPRIVGSSIDMGAFESGPLSPPALLVPSDFKVLSNIVVGEYAAPAPRVEVVDGAGNPLPAYCGLVTVSLSPFSDNGSLRGTFTRPIADGAATFTDLSLAVAGSYSLHFSSPGLAKEQRGFGGNDETFPFNVVPAYQPRFGDTNGDNTFDLTDVVHALRVLGGLDTPGQPPFTP